MLIENSGETGKGKYGEKNSPKPFLGEILGEMEFPQKKKNHCKESQKKQPMENEAAKKVMILIRPTQKITTTVLPSISYQITHTKFSPLSF